ncbi:MFS transporter [Mesorhizobium qingshengii]|uniref:MFS transporter n=1 Tax=Mesorhizobium qingshengii TaxID=1165689 RepID=A0ABT4R3F0_9HYPH|nr:MFS transporter [Mesorhizobium qingshengii]MCZ8548358.1 MFS transporter [Mesorhizobium qingshengii]
MPATTKNKAPPQALFVISLGFVALALAYSSRASVGLMMPIWERDLGWSRSFVSGGVALALIVMAVLAPVAGRLVDLQGSRNALTLGLAILSLGSGLMSGADSGTAFLLACGGLSAIGFGLIATHVVSTAVEQQLDRNQGLGISIATSGATAGQFLIVPLIAVMLTSLSWRWSYAALAVACAGLAVAIHWILPSGTRSVDTPATAAAPTLSLSADIKLILKNSTFHLLFWSYFICGYTTSGVIETHFLPYAALCGFAPVPSATAYGLLSAVNLAGMILVGWLTDRVNRPLLLGSIYVVRGLTFILLVNVGADYDTLLLFAIGFGLVDYATVPVTSSLVASHIGLRVMGLAFGLISAGHQIGGAIGAYLAGYLFDIYAQYTWVWWSSFWLAVLAGILAFVIRDRRPAQAALIGS